MVQVLKPAQREKILTAAGNQFATKGIEKASMRSIAKESGMTVGNLYRYYDGKESLARAVCQGAFDDLDAMLLEKTSGMFGLKQIESPVQSITLDQLRGVILKIVDGLVEVFEKNPQGIMILIREPHLYNQVRNWIMNLTKLVSRSCNDYVTTKPEEFELMAKMWADSILAGIVDAYGAALNHEVDLRFVLTRYFLVVLPQGE